MGNLIKNKNQTHYISKTLLNKVRKVSETELGLYYKSTDRIDGSEFLSTGFNLAKKKIKTKIYT